MVYYLFPGIYTSDKFGSDETGDGSENEPFKTILQAMRKAGKEPFPTIYVDPKDDNKAWDVASQSQLKKIKKIWARENSKNVEKAKKESEDGERREKNLEDAKKIIIKQDQSLPEPKQIKIKDSTVHRNERVKVFGWVHRLRKQGKSMMFIVLRDGTGFLQSLLSDDLVSFPHLDYF